MIFFFVLIFVIWFFLIDEFSSKDEFSPSLNILKFISLFLITLLGLPSLILPSFDNFSFDLDLMSVVVFVIFICFSSFSSSGFGFLTVPLLSTQIKYFFFFIFFLFLILWLRWLPLLRFIGLSSSISIFTILLNLSIFLFISASIVLFFSFISVFILICIFFFILESLLSSSSSSWSELTILIFLVIVIFFLEDFEFLEFLDLLSSSLFLSLTTSIRFSICFSIFCSSKSEFSWGSPSSSSWLSYLNDSFFEPFLELLFWMLLLFLLSVLIISICWVYSWGSFFPIFNFFFFFFLICFNLFLAILFSLNSSWFVFGTSSILISLLILSSSFSFSSVLLMS